MGTEHCPKTEDVIGQTPANLAKRYLCMMEIFDITARRNMSCDLLMHHYITEWTQNMGILGLKFTEPGFNCTEHLAMTDAVS